MQQIKENKVVWEIHNKGEFIDMASFSQGTESNTLTKTLWDCKDRHKLAFQKHEDTNVQLGEIPENWACQSRYAM